MTELPDVILTSNSRMKSPYVFSAQSQPKVPSPVLPTMAPSSTENFAPPTALQPSRFLPLKTAFKSSARIVARLAQNKATKSKPPLDLRYAVNRMEFIIHRKENICGPQMTSETRRPSTALDNPDSSPQTGADVVSQSTTGHRGPDVSFPIDLGHGKIFIPRGDARRAGGQRRGTRDRRVASRRLER